MSNIEGFTPIVGIFFAAFHPHEGTKILCQVPSNVVNIDTSFNDILADEINRKSKMSVATIDSEEDKNSFDMGSLSMSEYRLSENVRRSKNENNDTKLINFDDIKNHVIPKPEFCNRLLSVKAGRYRVIGFPVNIQEAFYARNSFNFNFCFIFEYDQDSTFYEPVVKRLGRMFKVLEEQLQILSKSSNDLAYFNIENKDIKEYISRRDLNNKYYNILNTFRPMGGRSLKQDTKSNEDINMAAEAAGSNVNNSLHTSQENKNAEFSIENMIQQIYQDLNNYSECSIKINAGNSVDIKLFPNIKLPDVNILPCDVPISTVNLDSLIDFYWDPNLLRISQHINGVNSIFKIAKLCNSDYEYTCACIRHLMAYKCIILLDTFSFQNIYATSSKISVFLEHKLLGEECRRYVYSSKDQNPLRNLPFTVLDSRRNGSYTLLNMDGQSHKSVDMETDQKSLDLNTDNAAIPVPIDTEDAKSDEKDQTYKNPKDSTSYEKQKNSSYVSESVDSLNQSGSTNRNYYDKSIYQLSSIQLFQLYIKFKQGKSVEKWYMENDSFLRDMDFDVRKFVTYGLLQGFLYRIYSYPMLVEYNSKWLSKCKVFYLEKNEATTRRLNAKFNAGNESELKKEMARILHDQEFMERYNSTHNLHPLSLEDIGARNYHLMEYRTTIFPKPGTNRDITTQRLNFHSNTGSNINSSLHGSSIFHQTETRNGYVYTPNTIGLQKFKNPKYIKLIKGAFDNRFYSLLSVITLKKEYLDKIKHFDQICTEFDLSRKEAEAVMKDFWKYHVVQR